jgi:hypothetical protein
MRKVKRGPPYTHYFNAVRRRPFALAASSRHSLTITLPVVLDHQHHEDDYKDCRYYRLQLINDLLGRSRELLRQCRPVVDDYKDQQRTDEESATTHLNHLLRI